MPWPHLGVGCRCCQHTPGYSTQPTLLQTRHQNTSCVGCFHYTRALADGATARWHTAVEAELHVEVEHTFWWLQFWSRVSTHGVMTVLGLTLALLGFLAWTTLMEVESMEDNTIFSGCAPLPHSLYADRVSSCLASARASAPGLS